LQISKRIALHGLNVSMAVFTGLSAYGILLYFDGGLEAAIALPARTTLLLAAGVAASIAGIGWFGVQLDRRKAEERRAEEQRKTEEAARKGRRKPLAGDAPP
jgi:hypothetical protein